MGSEILLEVVCFVKRDNHQGSMILLVFAA